MKNMAILKQEVSLHCLEAPETRIETYQCPLRAVLTLSFGRGFNQGADGFPRLCSMTVLRHTFLQQQTHQ